MFLIESIPYNQMVTLLRYLYQEWMSHPGPIKPLFSFRYLFFYDMFFSMFSSLFIFNLWYKIRDSTDCMSSSFVSNMHYMILIGLQEFFLAG